MTDKMYVDIETSGLEPAEGAVILSVALIVGDDEFEVCILPTQEQWEAASPEALFVNGMTLPYLMEHGVPLAQAVQQINDWCLAHDICADTLWVGQNPEFDHKFLWSHLNVVPNQYLDIRNMYTSLSDKGLLPRLQKRSGRHIAITLGVDPEPDVHTAIEGARVVKRNHDKLVALGAQQEPKPWKNGTQHRLF